MSRNEGRKQRRRERRARINLENDKGKAIVNKPQATHKGNDPEPEKGDDRVAVTAASDLSPAGTGQAKRKKSSKHGEPPKKIVGFFIAIWRGVIVLVRGRWIVDMFRFLDQHHGGVTAVATVAIGILTFAYVNYSKRQWQVAQDSLRIGQRAYVTIGKKDGVVADFIIPKDPSQDAEIVLYFHNSGHVPATFAWAPSIGLLGEGSKSKSGIVFTHPGMPMFPFMGLKGQGTELSIIAGDSIFVSTLGRISQRDLEQLPKNDPSLLILGSYEYCDELGDHESRMFGLRYRNNAPSSDMIFDLANDYSIGQIPPWIKNPCEEHNEQQSNKPETAWQKVRRWAHM
jgi:hypothetical protein